SLVTWTSQGPGPVNIASEGLNYQTAAGKITSLATDPRDPSGNTIYIGAPNGGVWKTVNGGKDWQAMTDNVTTSTGERIATPIGALAITSSGVIYAATGVEDNSFTSRTSNGILRSTNDGRSWTVLGQNTFRGAQIAK